MIDQKNLQQEAEQNCECACSYSGVCMNCRYFGTWHGDPWCDRYNNEIKDPGKEKGCYSD